MTSMEKIPVRLTVDAILRLLKAKYDLKVSRDNLRRQIMEKRKELYNLSKQINELEINIDKEVIKHLK